jgi:hypothetical protein
VVVGPVVEVLVVIRVVVVQPGVRVVLASGADPFAGPCHQVGAPSQHRFLR